MPATLAANKWNMMPMPLPRCHPLEIVVAPVLLAPASSFQYISLHISARRHNFYILANYFLGLGVLDFPPDKTQAKTHPLEALLSVGLAWPLFIFFLVVGCCFLLVCAVRKQNWRQLRNAHGALVGSLRGFTSQTPGCPPWIFPPVCMPLLLLIRFGDLGNSRSSRHSILFRETLCVRCSQVAGFSHPLQCVAVAVAPAYLCCLPLGAN